MKNWTGTPRRWVIGPVTAMVLLAGCSGSDSDSAESSSADTAVDVAQEAAGSPVTTTAAAADTIAAATDSEAAAAEVATGGGEAQIPLDPSAPSGRPEVFRAVISTASLTVTVGDVRAAAAQVRAAATAAGGFVASSEESAEDDGRAVVTIKVPPGDFDRLLGELGGLGEVERQDIDSEDVTDQVVDLDARIGVMHASVDRLIELIDQTNNIGEIASLEAELTRRTADLESLEGQLRVLSSQVSLSTITVTLQPIPVVSPDLPTLIGQVRTNPSFVDGLRAGWDSLVSVARDASVAVGAALPWMLPTSVVGLVALVVRRRYPPPTTVLPAPIP